MIRFASWAYEANGILSLCVSWKAGSQLIHPWKRKAKLGCLDIFWLEMPFCRRCGLAHDKHKCVIFKEPKRRPLSYERVHVPVLSRLKLFQISKKVKKFIIQRDKNWWMNFTGTARVWWFFCQSLKRLVALRQDVIKKWHWQLLSRSRCFAWKHI